MADKEKFTAERPNYPVGMWTVILRASRGGDAPIDPNAVGFLEGLVPVASADTNAQRRGLELDDDGILFARFDTWRPAAGQDVVTETVNCLLAGTRPLGLDVEVEAHMDHTADVNPVLTNHDNFNLLSSDVTVEAREAQRAAEEQPYELDTREFESL